MVRSRRQSWGVAFAAWAMTALGCGVAPEEAPVPSQGEATIFAALPSSTTGLIEVCTRLAAAGATHQVAQAFCANGEPTIGGISDVLGLMGLAFNGPTGRVAQILPNGNPAWALTSHSAALGRRLTNPLNPRAIILSPPGTRFDAEPGFRAVAYTRGETFLELMAHDAVRDTVEFFVLRFELPCQSRPEGCTDTELHSQAVESGWVRWSLYDEAQLRNTIFDCAVCHEHGYRFPRERKKGPLMFQLNGLWPHWLYNNGRFPGWEGKPEGPGPFHQNLLNYVAAHGTPDEPESETYAGIPGPNVFGSRPMSLEDLIEGNGYGNGFDAAAYRPNQRGDGLIDQGHAVLAALHRAGHLIAPPAAEDRPYHVARLEAATQDYAAFRRGERDTLPRLDDLFDETRLHEVGLGVTPDTTAPEILVEACTQCHHSALDQSVTRARFNVRVQTLGVEALEEAVHRLDLPETHHLSMPPHRLLELRPEERARLREWLVASIETRRGERRVESLPPAAFSLPPQGLNGTMVELRAAVPEVDAAPVEYRVVEVSGAVPDGEWQVSPYQVLVGLTPGTTYTFRVEMRLGDVVAAPSEPASVTPLPSPQRCYEIPGLGKNDIADDSDCDGVLNVDEADRDTDGDGIRDVFDVDDDEDGVPTSSETMMEALYGPDRDGDGVPSWIDDDSDGDGVPDVVESGGDYDGDGIHNFYDPE